MGRRTGAIVDCAGSSDDSAYAAMDFLSDALDKIASEIFASVAHLSNLDRRHHFQ